MIINENAWHVRIHDFFYNSRNRPHSLCPYFWKLAWVFFAVAVMCSAVLCGSWLAGHGILSYFGVTGFWALHAGGVGLGLSVVASIIGAIVCIAVAMAKIADWWYDRKYYKEIQRQRDKENGIERPKSLIIEYLKARKSKICPMLEFKDIK